MMINQMEQDISASLIYNLPIIDELNRMVINQVHDFIFTVMYAYYGPLAGYVKLRLVLAPGCRERFPRHARAVMHVGIAY